MPNVPPPPETVTGPPGAPVPNTRGEFVALISEVVERCLDRKLAELRDAGIDAPAEWLGTADAAEFLRCSTKHLGLMARRGDIPSTRLGRVLRFRRSDLDAYLEERRTGGDDA